MKNNQKNKNRKTSLKKQFIWGKICKGCFGMKHIIDQNIKLTFQISTKTIP